VLPAWKEEGEGRHHEVWSLEKDRGWHANQFTTSADEQNRQLVWDNGIADAPLESPLSAEKKQTRSAIAQTQDKKTSS
jgi:hypothetical protein